MKKNAGRKQRRYEMRKATIKRGRGYTKSLKRKRK